ncbi:hypothetical protein K461DRAFT_278187 [Myriangium duriaei CBS 260.36]|uniref:SRPBCC domain-containing protein n=1 Tax=Myriangium duriaei CBS 260.36 TaxID=1168546 RepID=A0A9P4MN49_9PEZI|nr:hypothetical protein K461DRAFT_278187 [Myriangium duriaei CBS 260.36]
MTHHEILETTNQPAGTGVFTFYGSAKIQASAQAVWEALTDLQSYSKWNEYTPRIDTPAGTNAIAVDDMITLHYRPETTGALSEIPCKVLEVNPEAMRLCWRGYPKGIPQFLLFPEKVHRITAVSENECFIEVFETQSGPMAYVVKWTMGAKLTTYQNGMLQALKGFVEGKASA